MNQPETAQCTARIENEHSNGAHRCVLEAGHQDPEWGADHAAPVNDDGTRYQWSDDAIGAVPHAVSSAGQAPATNHTNLREQIAETLATAEGWTWAHGLQFKDIDTPSAEAYRKLADAVLAALPAPTDRAATLRWAADQIEKAADDHQDYYVPQGLYDAADRLRRLADETPHTQTDTHVCDPGATAYYCPTSGETESNCHGGFTTCCDRPDLHQPAAGARQDGDQPSLRDQHRATWQALTPDQQTARLAELDEEQDGDQT